MIVSSEARQALELRGPYDVINLATLLGLSEGDAKANHTPCVPCSALQFVMVVKNLASEYEMRQLMLLTSCFYMAFKCDCMADID